MLSTTTTETLRTTETAQAWYTDATYSAILWVPTCKLSRYLTTILQPLTDKSRRKLQSTDQSNFIDAIKTVQIADRQLQTCVF